MLLSRSSNQGQIGDDLLGVLSFTSTRLTGDKHGLIFKIEKHVAISSLSDGPQVGWDLIPPLAQIDLDHTLGVDGEALVGVDNNAEEARVGVDESGFEACLQVVEDRGVIEVGQVGHVLTFLKLVRIDLTNLLSLEDFFLQINKVASEQLFKRLPLKNLTEQVEGFKGI